jgi:hypothetical protein
MKQIYLQNQQYQKRNLSKYLLPSKFNVLVKCMIIYLSSTIFFLNLINVSSNVQWTAWLVIFLSIYLMFVVRGNFLLLICYSIIAYCNYSIVTANYINILDSSYFTSFSNDPVSDIGLNLLLLFTISLTIFTPTHINPLNISRDTFLRENTNNAHIILYGIAVVLLYILIFEFDRPDVLGERGSPSPVYEYSIVFFIVGFYFVGKNRIFKSVLALLLMLFVLQNFLYGGRVIGIQLLLLYFIIFYSYKANFYKLLPIITIGFILMSMIGAQRASLEVSFETIANVIDILQKKSFALDTAYSAYFTSLTFLKVEAFTDFYTRFQLLLQYILSMFLGGSLVPNNSLPAYSLKSFTHYGGGVFPYYFKFYLGWIGVFLCPLLIYFYTKLINELKIGSVKGLSLCLAVYVASTVFRWYLYTPTIILRGVVLLAVTYYIAYLISKLKD